MPTKRGRGASFRVEFDDATFADDLAHNSPAARDAGERKRSETEHNGQPVEGLLPCDIEARDGTSLPGCMKTRVPWQDGPWGMVFRLHFDSEGKPFLACLAFGTRHPGGPGKPSVYEVADRRLNR
jgi:hypothetical protein